LKKKAQTKRWILKELNNFNLSNAFKNNLHIDTSSERFDSCLPYLVAQVAEEGLNRHVFLNNKLLSQYLCHIRFSHHAPPSDIYVQYIFNHQLQLWVHHCLFERVSWGVKCVLSADHFLYLPSVISASVIRITELNQLSANELMLFNERIQWTNPCKFQ